LLACWASDPIAFDERHTLRFNVLYLAMDVLIHVMQEGFDIELFLRNFIEAAFPNRGNVWSYNLIREEGAELLSRLGGFVHRILIAFLLT
ncbi:hypothetical protein, partial [Acinetobacter sp. LMB-5]|uniref:hypothetical protein n=1 Tax=Acinetobacter sp. LMB-5 TaxID=1609919 RepID=UPI001BB37D36